MMAGMLTQGVANEFPWCHPEGRPGRPEGSQRMIPATTNALQQNDGLACLDQTLFLTAVRELKARDAHLAEVLHKYGQPPLWVREPGFPTLVYIILEQQVSLASAKAAFDRLNAALRPLSPRGFLKLTDQELKRIGFSRQKTLYTRLLADSLARRHFDLRYLHDLHDDV